MERDEALELLKAQHIFPGPYDFRVVVRTGSASAVVTTAVRAAVPGLSVSGVTEKPSRKGTYVALRIATTCLSAEMVLAVYAILQELDEVLITM